MTSRALEPVVTGSHEDLIVDALVRRDDAALESWIRRVGPVVRSTALAHVGSPAAADDVVQDTWVAVLAGIERFERRSSLLTWVIGIALNIARSRARTDRRTIPVDWTTAEPRPDARGWLDPEDAALTAELRTALGTAIGSLPVRQRRVVHLHDVLGAPSDEVCATLALSAGNQRVLLHRGRGALRVQLATFGAVSS